MSGACRSCGAEALNDLGPCPEYSDVPAGWDAWPAGRLLRCRQCALMQRSECPAPQDLARLYALASGDAMEYAFFDNAAWVGARRALLAQFPADRQCRVLDVGCHTGGFLGGLPSRWVRHGIEGAVEPARIARERHGVDIVGARIEDTDPASTGRYDAITMFDVIEHLSDPSRALAQAARLLAPGGLLLLSSADGDAWTWKWLGSQHWYLRTPQHLSVVSGTFLRTSAPICNLQLRQLRRIPHRLAPWRVRAKQFLEAVYWGLRLRRAGWGRVPHRLVQSLPGLRELRHLRSVPWTMALADHMLAVLAPQAQPPS